MKRAFLPVERLSTLYEDLRCFQSANELNGYQEWILHSMYDFQLPKVDFDIQSVCIVVSPIWARQDVSFVFDGRECIYPMPGGLLNPEDSLEGLLARFITEGIRVVPAENLPKKRLAVCSGLAKYGRNNITYVEGMGSYFLISAFYTDQPCGVDRWREVVKMQECSTCEKCVQACPTSTIATNRFLIDNVRCLTAMNQGAEPIAFPEWVDPSAHTCVHDCLTCQSVCPVNAPYQKYKAPLISFTEAETEMLLNVIPYEQMDELMRAKVDRLDLKPYLAALPRNLSALRKQST